MQEKFKRIPLCVGVLYSKDGEIVPKAISLNGERFLIDKIIRKRNYYPRVVPAIAPTEFTVMVAGEEKKIYFEKDTGKWFSVKKLKNEGQSNFTQ